MSMDKRTGPADFIAHNATVLGSVTIKENVSIWFGAVIRADKDDIIIGESSNVQDNAVIHTSKGYPVHIGNQVSIGHGAILHGCIVRDRVLVGMGAIILNGAVIGDDSILGAGTVVTEGADIPPGSLVLGVPGKVIKPTTPEQKMGIVNNAESYMELAKRYRNA
ncbi:MAG: gamma carbonic anhydrase family protein [Methanoregulaceae archaeon]|nr:gamma carbonic anhydrase family protein [Methanoregulaceae archaeon]